MAGAERQMASANAAIGVSRAAFYPNITLSANAGFEAAGFGLLSLSNSLWMIGASAVVPLFEGGLRRAELQRSWSQQRLLQKPKATCCAPPCEVRPLCRGPRPHYV